MHLFQTCQTLSDTSNTVHCQADRMHPLQRPVLRPLYSDDLIPIIKFAELAALSFNGRKVVHDDAIVLPGIIFLWEISKKLKRGSKY